MIGRILVVDCEPENPDSQGDGAKRAFPATTCLPSSPSQVSQTANGLREADDVIHKRRRAWKRLRAQVSPACIFDTSGLRQMADRLRPKELCAACSFIFRGISAILAPTSGRRPPIL